MNIWKKGIIEDEDICDDFIVIFESKHIYKGLYEMKTLYNNNIHNAIWTDKGLIYVAKLNEKGVLELL